MELQRVLLASAGPLILLSAAGVDSGGNNLHPEMPRWTGLTASDLDDLIGFLKALGAVRRDSAELSQGL